MRETSMIDCLMINAISKEYKRGKVKANSNITTSFYPGQVVAIIGHNGAGKTTLLNQIIGNVKPDRGDIVYRGYSLLRNTKLARNIVSMMPQFQAPLVGVTLRQCIESILYVRCIRGEQAKILTEQIILDLDIKPWENQSGNKLSGGVQRLASFAMAVVCPTPIILLDEPTNDVDPVRRKLVWKYMRKLAHEGHIVVVVTHNLLEVEQYADRYLLFDHGKLIQDSSTRGIYQQYSKNTLMAIVEDASVLYDVPSSFDIKYIEEEASMILNLPSEQVLEAMNWMLNMINEGKIVSYKLSSSSLDASYGGLTNAK